MTLTEAAYWTRRLGLLSGIGLVLLTILVVVLIWINLNPGNLDDFLRPDYACTTFPQEFQAERLVIPSLQLATNSAEIIEINTLTGKPESIPNVANVYEFDHPTPSLTAEEKAKNIGEKLGFTPSEMRRRGTIQFYWLEDPFGRTLTIEANTLNYELKVNYRNEASLPEEPVLPSNEQAKSIASNFLSSNGWLLSSYRKDDPIITLISIEPDGSFSMAPSRADADLIRVDFIRSSPFLQIPDTIASASVIRSQLERRYEGYQSIEETVQIGGKRIQLYNFMALVVTPDPEKSNLSVYVGPDYNRKAEFNIPKNIYGVDYKSWVVQQDPCGRYPLISVKEVTDKITAGEASLVYLNDKDGDTVIPYRPRLATRLQINTITLGYLDTPDKQRYLQPIYIVNGSAIMEDGRDGEFYYFIPAIDYDNIQPAQKSTETEQDTEENTTNTPFL